MRRGAGLRRERFGIPTIGGQAHLVRMISNEETAHGQAHGHQYTQDHVGGLPIPHKNHPGDHWREDKRSDTVARHHDTHDEAATFFKPPRDQRRCGEKKGAPPYRSDEPVPKIKRFDRCRRAGHVDPQAVHDGAQEKDQTHTMGVEEGTDNEDANTGDQRGECIRKGQGTMRPAHVFCHRCDEHPKTHHGARSYRGHHETGSQDYPAIEEATTCRIRSRSASGCGHQYLPYMCGES